MSQPTQSSKMSSAERKATLSLAGVMSLRMLGIFMILPIFSLYAAHLVGATPTLIGMGIGIYGLTQGLLQLPFGTLSDHVGRKKIIVLGLSIFALGSILAALAHNIIWVIIGRALQGGGAVGSTIMALLADLTRENQRTKAMAMMGMTIGMSFSLAFVLGPLLNNWFHASGIFWVSAGLSVLGILLLFTCVPKATLSFHADTEPEFNQFFNLLKHPELARLNLGIFILHAVLTASFVVIPLSLQNLAGLAGHDQWKLYLPILIAAFVAAIPVIIIAEKKYRLKQCFLGAIILLAIAELLLWIFAKELILTSFGLFLFFTGFTVLEAFLPSLVSKTTPKNRKGTALGIYSSSQFLGIFIGGLLGGFLFGKFGLTDVYLFCVILTILWATIAFNMKNPQHQISN